MRWSDISFRPAPTVLRQFAGIWLFFFGSWAVWQYAGRGHATSAAVLTALALLVGLPGLLHPPLVQWVYAGATLASFPIGWVISHLVMAAVFYLLITPLAMIFRLMGRDVLHRRKPAVESYWFDKRTAEEADGYLKQY